MVDEFLQQSFPKRPFWWQKSTFPVAIPCPVSLFVHFFHDRIVSETDTMRQLYYDKIIKWETLVIFSVSWFVTATWGCRSIVVPDMTIELIRRELGNIILFRDISTYRILDMMETTSQKARRFPELLNRIVATDVNNLKSLVGEIAGNMSDYIEDSFFKHSKRLTGEIKFTNYARQLFFWIQRIGI